MAEIVMPRLSDTMEEGTILRWLAADGEPVRRGQEIVEIETDKATMTYESDLDGVLQIVAAEGDTLPVGAVIAQVGSGDGTGVGGQDAHVTSGGGDANEGAVAAAGQSGAATPSTPAEAVREAIPGPVAETSPTANQKRVKASPLARRIARENDVDLHALTGTGPGGRIVKADVQAVASTVHTETPRTTADAADGPSGVADTATTGAAAGSSPGAALAGVTTARGETTEIELSRTQQTIARRMAESKATIPHFSLQADIDMEECVALRSELKRLGQADAPTYNDMVVKACALALREHPRANSSYRDGRLQLHGRVNVGIAVAVEADGPSSGGVLIVPTVFDADAKSLGEIARETRALASRVREHSITPPELGGGTFTVSNLGMFGVSAFTAIVNPPQAAILAVGSVGPRPVVREDGEIAARQTMTVTLACDHRILYGADAARFLARIRELLEQPASLTL
ncbi:MAG TPA: dihydrolipoamide acetyltransferase family protein [Solirubrobacteraceae bacterium]|jgi:pyruvate dehydrogenase E2 component (dihydrolipoamide acetyltransferase)|nr:dihydrolipoamide acetyltransferase family protein [Solirubrobacteraceae bacterium]